MPRIGAFCLLLAVALASTATAFSPLPASATKLSTRLHAVQQYSTISPIDEAPTFKYLSNLDAQVEKMCKNENEFLLSFWDAELQCFMINPNQPSEKISVTTTLMGLSAIKANPDHWSKIATYQNQDGESNGDKAGGGSKICLKGIINSLNAAPWDSSNNFQNILLISTLCDYNSFDPEEPKARSAILSLLKNRSKLSDHTEQELSSYLRYHSAKALISLLERDKIPKDIEEECGTVSFYIIHLSFFFSDSA
jgi:hypothetical protein